MSCILHLFASVFYLLSVSRSSALLLVIYISSMFFQKKCAKYWPDSSTEKVFDYDDNKLVIQFSKETNHSHYILREFVIKLENVEVRYTD